jgi:xanthine dehydrogenase large subunit
VSERRHALRRPLPHDSAWMHVTGEARYVDDLIEPRGLLHAAIGMSTRAHARLRAVDLEPVRAAPGVVAVVTAANIPGVNDVGPVVADEPLLADGEVHYAGQAIFAVAAHRVEQARRAARAARIDDEELPAILSIEQALEAGSFVAPTRTFQTGDAGAAIARSRHVLEGELRTGAQDHFYLEGQVAMALPGEDGAMLVHSSTQHPSEVQHAVAKVLGRPDAAVTVEVRRMGGGFGGKETQAAPVAAIAALLADRAGRPVKLRLDRDDDMVLTGKRHDFLVRYRVGCDGEGRIEGVEIELAARCGWSADLSAAVVDRAMFHADNAYFLPHATIVGHRCRTNTVSSTAFRGFGGPQGMMAIEQVIDVIARRLGRDPLDVRRANLYGPGRDVTPYHMTVEDNILPELLDELEAWSDYRARREAARGFNATSPLLKRGIALTPVKFGIAFTTTHLNQAGALVHVYTDGSVQLSHGGTEMGQGLMIKVAQVAAEELCLPLERIRITATRTDKVPNTSATAASSGSDLNGAAARIACRTLRRRLTTFAASHLGVAEGEVRWRLGAIEARGRTLAFEALVEAAHRARVPLSATGFYCTPKIHFDLEQGKGRPFLYFAYGAAVSEVLVDTLTGEHRVLRADLLHDVGRSLNPAVDMGQIEGGFVQGMGWLTMEEVCWDDSGRITTHAPSTYKIPVASDMPADFRVRVFERGDNREPVVHRSKAVGEPPLMLAISVFHAIRDAVSSVAPGLPVRLDAPATPERVLLAVEGLKARIRPAEAAE